MIEKQRSLRFQEKAFGKDAPERCEPLMDFLGRLNKLMACVRIDYEYRAHNTLW